MGDVLTARVRLVATAGPGEGRGHVSRALAVAEALADRGASVELVLARGTATPAEAARVAAIGTLVEDAARSTRDDPHGSSARGRVDAVDAVLVDLPDANDAESWRQPAASLIVVDDRNRFAAHADAIVQPSLPEWSGPGSADRVESGYAWIPLSGAYTRLANVAAGVSPAGPREIFLCLGGSDPGLVTERLVRSVPDRAVPALSVVVGAGYRGRTDGWPVEPAVDPPDLPDRLGRATVAILGGGTMKFEAACLGVPAVLVAAADDQLPVGPPFAATGAAAWAGDGRRVDPALVWTVALRLLDDASERDAMARRGREVVDGLGAGRIAELVLATIAERRAG